MTDDLHATAITPIDHGTVLSWATDLEENTLEQALRTASLDIVNKPLALMADAHLGMGATIGSVIATTDAIIPAAVGVDIGCGMVAQRTTLTRDDVDGHLDAIHAGIATSVPSGQPKKDKPRSGSHGDPVRSPVLDALIKRAPAVDERGYSNEKIASQFGTLGGGNHFVELSVDETDRVWAVLHSGSRGPGNLIARHHIGRASTAMQDTLEAPLADPDLAWFVQGTTDFADYVEAMLWAQDYALANRQQMIDAVIGVIEAVIAPTQPIRDGASIQCHHNYAAKEVHHDTEVWVTRKGAIDASVGNRGIIPGSMATGSYIVSGLGAPASYRSASHGAGRRLSRRQAKRQLSADSLTVAMRDIAWNDDAEALLDEHPDAYKDLDQVMANQSELVRVDHRLTTILNYKGT